MRELKSPFDGDKGIADPFEWRLFYELMQQYRWAKELPQSDVIRAFEAVKEFGRGAVALSTPMSPQEPTPSAEPEHGSFEWRLQDAQRVLDAPAPKGWVTQVVRRDFLQKLIDIAHASLYAPAGDSDKKCICIYDREKGTWSTDPECPTCSAALSSPPVLAVEEGRDAKDAARYRFLRAHGALWVDAAHDFWKYDQHLDSAVDAAMRPTVGEDA